MKKKRLNKREEEPHARQQARAPKLSTHTSTEGRAWPTIPSTKEKKRRWWKRDGKRAIIVIRIWECANNEWTLFALWYSSINVQGLRQHPNSSIYSGSGTIIESHTISKAMVFFFKKLGTCATLVILKAWHVRLLSHLMVKFLNSACVAFRRSDEIIICPWLILIYKMGNNFAMNSAKRHLFVRI